MRPNRPHPTRPDVHPANDDHASASAADLLAAWRSDRVATAAEIEAIRDLLSTRVLLHRRGWRDALRNAPAAVIGAAIDLAIAECLTGPAADVVMSAVLVEATTRRNPAARLVLDHARARVR